MAITTQMRTDVSQLYVALFGRAPDGEGLGYWVSQLDAGKSIVDIANAMYGTAPARTYYPSYLTNQEIVGNFYTNVLGRTADAEGLAYWTDKLNAAGATPGSVIAEIIGVVANYTGTDPAGLKSAALFQNKVQVAQWYGEQNGNIDGAMTILNGVTEDPATVEAAKTGGVQSGQTFMLTAGEEHLVGTTGNDTFNALIDVDGRQTLQSFDTVDGGAGTDALVATLLGDVTKIATTSVEVLTLRGENPLTEEGGLELTVGIASDVTTLNNNTTDADGLVINGAAGLAIINTGGEGSITVNDLKASALTLNADIAKVSHYVDLNSFDGTTGPANLTVNMNGADGYLYMTTSSTLKNLVLNVENGGKWGTDYYSWADDTSSGYHLDSDASNLTTWTITGTGDVSVGIESSDAPKLTTFDASGLKGGVYTDYRLEGTSDTPSVLKTVIGGQGDDSIDVQYLAADGSVSTGTGNDYVDVWGQQGNSTVDGGAGNDEMYVEIIAKKATVVIGGDGNDTIDVWSEAATDPKTVTGTTLTVNGGAGDDSVWAGNLTGAVSTVTFNGGDGVDTINISSGLDLATSKLISNFEILDVTGSEGATYDLSREASFTAVQVSDNGGGNANLVNVAAGTNIAIIDGAEGAISYNLDDTSGKTDAVSVKFNLDDSTSVGYDAYDSKPTDIFAGSLILDAVGVEIVNVEATAEVGKYDKKGNNSYGTVAEQDLAYADDAAVSGSAYHAQLTIGNNNATVKTVNVTGNAGLTLTLDSKVTLVDASGNAGGVTTTFTAATASEFKGGAGNDGVTTNVAGGVNTVVYGGAGADTINASDAYTGDPAVLSVKSIVTAVYKAGTDSGIATKLDTDGVTKLFDSSKLDTITSFTEYDTTGKVGDRIDLSAFGFATAKTTAVTLKDLTGLDTVNAGDDADLLALLKSTTAGTDFFKDGSLVNAVAVWHATGDAGADSYVFVDANKDGNFSSTDLVIKVVGDSPIISDLIFVA